MVCSLVLALTSPAQTAPHNTTEETTQFIRSNHELLETYFIEQVQNFLVLEASVSSINKVANEVPCTFDIEDFKSSEKANLQTQIKTLLLQWLEKKSVIVDPDTVEVTVSGVQMKSSTGTVTMVIVFEDGSAAIRECLSLCCTDSLGIGIILGVVHVVGLLAIIGAVVYYNRRKKNKHTPFEGIEDNGEDKDVEVKLEDSDETNSLSSGISSSEEVVEEK